MKPDSNLDSRAEMLIPATPRAAINDGDNSIGDNNIRDALENTMFSLAIYYCDFHPTQCDINDAVRLGFNMIGVSYSSNTVLNSVVSMLKNTNLRIMIDLDLKVERTADVMGQDWTVLHAAAEETTNNHLNVDIYQSARSWDDHISHLQDNISAFRCVNVGEVPPLVWRQLIFAAKQRNPMSLFCAWTVGMAPETVSSLSKCGFDAVFSSSCWWDFRSSWLQEETKRLEVLGHIITLVTPPDTIWVSNLTERRRALDLAAFYAPGWLMAAGFQNCDNECLDERIIQLNRFRRDHVGLTSSSKTHLVSSDGSTVVVLKRIDDFVLVANLSKTKQVEFDVSDYAGKLCGRLRRLEQTNIISNRVFISPGASDIFEIVPVPSVLIQRITPPNCDAPRIVIESIAPQVDQGTLPVRRVVGEYITVEADLISDGHDKIAAEVVWRYDDEVAWQHASMHLLSNDRWQGSFQLDRLGRYTYAIIAWKDEYATFVDQLIKKINAKTATRLDLEEGISLIQEASAASRKVGWEKFEALLLSLEDVDDEKKTSFLLAKDTINKLSIEGIRKFEVRSYDITVDAERFGSRFASWYEIFPRSQSGDSARHGTFRDVIGQLSRIASMGFDVLYFPPIHPIGRINRKGKNNSLTSFENDPGSPYAIGSSDGGHDAIHPELGNMDDFVYLVHEAKKFGIEIALDFAIQCAPDHPWVSKHKEWFDWRSDGTLKYAENPPKKYEDIVNVDFYKQAAKPSLWEALRDVVQFWVDRGIRLFRVDNPHTKPLPFWAWLINDIRSRHPDAIFLAEAFTRPKIMYRLAKIGFSQSYTYFTWRNTKPELVAYLTELNDVGLREYFRPHFFVNTPDINPLFLQQSGRSGFLIRAALAATLSGLWGVYNGFELCEAEPAALGKEEYLDSEKYQIKKWNYEKSGNIVAEITKLNDIRRRNSALQSHLGIRFHNAFDDQILFFSKKAQDGNTVLVAICLDPFNTHQFKIELPLWLFDLSDDASLIATDLIRDFEFSWHGKFQDVTLHPLSPFCIWRVRPEGDDSWI